MLAVLLFVFVAIILFVLGYLIRVQKRLSLLAGYDPARVVDPDALARLAGSVLYIMGAGTLLVPFLLLVFAGDDAGVMIGVGYMVFIWAGVLILVLRARRYLK